MKMMKTTKIKNKKVLLGLIILGITSCTNNDPNRSSSSTYNKIQQTFDDSLDGNKKVKAAKLNNRKNIYNKLMPRVSATSSNQGNSSQEKRFSVSAKNIAAKQFFLALTKDSKQNIIISPRISGDISLNMKNVTLEEVLESIESVYGYVYRQTNNGYEIFPNDTLETEILHVNYLNAKRSGSSNTEITSGEIINSSSGGTGTTGTSSTSSSGGSSSGSSVKTNYDIDFWKTLETSLKEMVGAEKGRSILVDPLSGTVLVKAYPKEIKEIREYLDIIQHRMYKQVIIEAKILEVQLNDQYEMGIQWEKIGSAFDGTILKNTTIPTFSSTDGTTTTTTEGFGTDIFGSLIKFKDKNFSGILNALSTQGDVTVLSSPRVSTMNNQKAVIKVGSNEFFVTNVSTTQVASSTAGTSTQDIELTPFFEGISLDVIPQINEKNVITLHLRPSISNIEEVTKNITVNSQNNSLPLAKSTIRESDNIVSAYNQQVIVIGGLMQSRIEEEIQRTPFIGKIPFLGVPFRYTKQNRVNTELVILLRPTIVEADTWNNSITQYKNEFDDNYRGYHVGESPEVFGVEGETSMFKKNNNRHNMRNENNGRHSRHARLDKFYK